MRKLILSGIVGFMLLTSSLLLVTTAAAGPASTANASKLIVAMRTPAVTGSTTAARRITASTPRQRFDTGPVKLHNLDEARLIVKGPGGTKHGRSRFDDDP